MPSNSKGLRRNIIEFSTAKCSVLKRNFVTFGKEIYRQEISTSNARIRRCENGNGESIVGNEELETVQKQREPLRFRADTEPAAVY